MLLPLPSSRWTAAVATALALATAPAWADTLSSSALFNSFSTSVGSVSTSFNASSDASSPGRPLKVGDYRIQQMVAMADQPGRAGMMRLTLRAATPATSDEAAAAEARDDYFLYLPQETVARAALAEGQVITARARPYGLELARAAAPEQAATAFFLVVADDWYRELQTRAVTL